MKEPQAQHTPGPWEVARAKSEHEAAINMMKIVGPERYLGIASAFGDTTEETQANAHLIAAAPDMLAALKRAEPWLGRLIADGGHKDCCASNDAIATLQRVSAAIAKAVHTQ